MTNQTTGTLTYARPLANNTVSTPLPAEYTFAPTTTANQFLVTKYLTLDPNNVAQVDTITITVGVDDDIYTVEVDDGTEVDNFAYIQQAGNTADVIADKLAKRIDLHPGVTATATTNVITVTSTIPGTVVNYDPVASTTPANIVVASTTAASGTPAHGKIAETTLTFSIADTTTPKVTYQTQWFNGNPTTPESSAQGSLQLDNHPLTVDEIQTNNGFPQA